MIQAVFPADGNNCSQLAQATFFRIYFLSMAANKTGQKGPDFRERGICGVWVPV
jgi:hypothetical protein